MKKTIALSLAGIVFVCGLVAQNITLKEGLYVADDGKLYTGVFTNFTANQIKDFTITIVEGKTKGAVTYYYPSGTISETGEFLDNEKNGEWIRYDEKGNKTASANYLNGKKDGTWLIWDFNGIKRCEMHYALGEKKGKWIMWDETGNLTSEKVYSTL